jgi:Peptidase propeptide and YPEB domain
VLHMNLVLVLLASVFVSAGGAKVRLKEESPGLLAKAKVTADAAVATAQEKVPKSRLSGAEIEMENGKLIYSFDFKTGGKRGSEEVTVDATTGAVLTVEHESPKAETDEKKAEAKEKARAKQ